MLAQTDFQHISGTRVAMDFVEVPSVLMEYFAKSPQVLIGCGRHYKTQEPIPLSSIDHHLSNQKVLQALETQNQIQMALLDQAYHSSLAMDPRFNSSEIMFNLTSRVNSIAATRETAWQAQFSHLFTYGASYYSYLWSRKWASQLNNKLFANKPRSDWRQGGEILRSEILGVGGSRDASIGLETVIGKSA